MPHIGPFGLPDLIALIGFIGVCYLAVKFGQWLGFGHKRQG